MKDFICIAAGITGIIAYLIGIFVLSTANGAIHEIAGVALMMLATLKFILVALLVKE
jgi:hypothetical protein